MSQNGDVIDYDNSSYLSKTIRNALYKLESSLGRATVDTIIQDMEIYGTPLVNDHVSYTIAEITLAMEGIFGIEGSKIIIERLKKTLLRSN